MVTQHLPARSYKFFAPRPSDSAVAGHGDGAPSVVGTVPVAVLGTVPVLSFLVRRLRHADEVVDAVAFDFLRFALRGEGDVEGERT